MFIPGFYYTWVLGGFCGCCGCCMGGCCGCCVGAGWVLGAPSSMACSTSRPDAPPCRRTAYAVLPCLCLLASLRPRPSSAPAGSSSTLPRRRIAYMVWKGRRGYSWDDIPDLPMLQLD